MKKLVVVSLLILSSFASCQNDKKIEDAFFSKDIVCSSSIIDNDIHFFASTIEETQYIDNVLEKSMTIKITNNSNKEKRINISNLKLYGNNQILKYKIYSEFDYETKNKVDAFQGEILLKPEEKKTLSYLFLIPYGNSSAHYDVIGDINNVKLDLRYYDEDSSNLFTYIHDPKINEKAMSDIEYNAEAAYGFIPLETGTLAQYVNYAWTDIESAKGYKEERIKYHKMNNENIKALEKKLRQEEKTIEEIARACSALRNQNRFDMYEKEEDIKKLKERNLEVYGNEQGPTPEYLFEKYGSWEKVLEKSYSINVGMDACCGLYDEFFEYYNLPIPSYIEEA